MKHLNVISCGQGAPSLFLIVLAGEGVIKADVVITADTGWENDMLWNTNERTTAREFFERVTQPLAASYGIPAAFVRTLDENGKPYEPIPDAIARKQKLAGSEQYKSEYYGLDIPMFGSNGGKLRQACTSKWKVQGINQECRRRGADTVTTYLGIHLDEIRRLKPSGDARRRHGWPLVDLRENDKGGVIPMGIGRRWNRESVQVEMETRGLPYLVSTECDGCPHKDLARWRRTSPETIKQLATWERETGQGNFFLTEERIPLEEAIAAKEEAAKQQQPSFFDQCDSGFCMIG